MGVTPSVAEDTVAGQQHAHSSNPTFPHVHVPPVVPQPPWYASRWTGKLSDKRRDKNWAQLFPATCRVSFGFWVRWDVYWALHRVSFGFWMRWDVYWALHRVWFGFWMWCDLCWPLHSVWIGSECVMGCGLTSVQGFHCSPGPAGGVDGQPQGQLTKSDLSKLAAGQVTCNTHQAWC